MFLTTEKVRFLLERGADPDWIAPNGSSALEHALLRYWNGEVVDLIARRATPRAALWIAAGLGDVDGVARFLDKRGKPTAAAYRNRPDFAAAGGPSFMLSAPAPDDTEILAEAFMVAMVNDRIAVLDYMIDRGFPVDFLEWEMPFVSFAAGNQRVRVVECLVRRGANLDIRGRHPDMSAREMARERFEGMPSDPTARRILELCGLDPEQVITEMEARPAPEPQITRLLLEALELAGDDAARQRAGRHRSGQPAHRHTSRGARRFDGAVALRGRGRRAAARGDRRACVAGGRSRAARQTPAERRRAGRDARGDRHRASTKAGRACSSGTCCARWPMPTMHSCAIFSRAADPASRSSTRGSARWIPDGAVANPGAIDAR